MIEQCKHTTKIAILTYLPTYYAQTFLNKKDINIKGWYTKIIYLFIYNNRNNKIIDSIQARLTIEIK